MSIHETSCTYKGDRFFGVFEVAGTGQSANVCVRYNGEELVAPTSGQPAIDVASHLLGELVVRKDIARTVDAGPHAATAELQLGGEG